MANAKKISFDELLAEHEELAKKTAVGDTLTGIVTSVKKHEILIDLGVQGTGLVSRKEASFARNLKVGGRGCRDAGWHRVAFAPQSCERQGLG